MMHDHAMPNHDHHQSSAHHADHGGHELMFRNRFWVSLYQPEKTNAYKI